MSGSSPERFGGKDLYIPGYYGQRNLAALDVAGAAGSIMLLVGECKAGIPFNASDEYPNVLDRINFVSNTEDLKKGLRDGPSYYGAQFAMTPVNHEGLAGAQFVGVIRVNQATRSALTIPDIDTDDVLDIKSKDYGLYTNQIRFKLSTGTTIGKKISVKFESKTIEQDDITDEIFQVQYTGTGSACVLTIDPAGNLVTVVTAGAAGDDIAAMSLATYDKAQNLVDAINAYQNTGGTNVYSAVLLGDGNFDTNKLDKIITGDAVDIKTVKTVSAILQACIDWFNNSSDDLLTAELSSGAERRVPENMTGYEYITGGTEGAAVTTQDYTDALSQVVAIQEASFVGVMTGDAAIHAVLSAHVTAMSDVDGRKERQGCVGSAKSASDSTMKSESKVINNSLMGYCGTEIKRYDKNGELLTWAGFYKACEIMGISAGNPITTAPTNKMINAVGVNKVYGVPALNQFIKSGVIIAQPSDLGGIRVVKSVTTFQGSNKIANEWSAMRTVLHITKDHRTYVESLVGEPGDNTIIESLKTRAKLRLDFYVEQGWLVVDPDLGNAYRNVQFTIVGDKFKMTYEGTLVIPINFIFVTHNFTVVGFKK